MRNLACAIVSVGFVLAGTVLLINHQEGWGLFTLGAAFGFGMLAWASKQQ